ncbi:MAG: hypothetical protein KME38_18560, partial [Spirirestis rafaelensis WJT71-NPBG6]|nr:hypothetical protein [Spirirestis rafaelensis WJT71-NPBG6]
PQMFSALIRQSRMRAENDFDFPRSLSPPYGYIEGGDFRDTVNLISLTSNFLLLRLAQQLILIRERFEIECVDAQRLVARHRYQQRWFSDCWSCGHGIISFALS